LGIDQEKGLLRQRMNRMDLKPVILRYVERLDACDERAQLMKNYRPLITAKKRWDILGANYGISCKIRLQT